MTVQASPEVIKAAMGMNVGKPAAQKKEKTDVLNNSTEESKQLKDEKEVLVEKPKIQKYSKDQVNQAFKNSELDCPTSLNLCPTSNLALLEKLVASQPRKGLELFSMVEGQDSKVKK